jgi:hypothetical protein
MMGSSDVLPGKLMTDEIFHKKRKITDGEQEIECTIRF